MIIVGPANEFLYIANPVEIATRHNGPEGGHIYGELAKRANVTLYTHTKKSQGFDKSYTSNVGEDPE